MPNPEIMSMKNFLILKEKRILKWGMIFFLTANSGGASITYSSNECKWEYDENEYHREIKY